MRGVMDACSDPAVHEVVVMAGAQLGKTEALLNIIGYHVDHDPCPMLVLQPTLEMARAFSKDRLAAGLLDTTPCLKGRVKDSRVRDGGNTTLHKIYPGGAISIQGANSPSGLASRGVRMVLADEVDRMPASAGSEGDPILLARKRSATFWNRLLVMVSTPTIQGASRIEDAYLASDQRRYHVPCKHCGHFQTLRWQQVKWHENDPASARYECEECGTLWDESERAWSVRNGQWVAEEPDRTVVGFTISGLYSPWTTLADAVAEFLQVRKHPDQLRVWTNTYLAETWQDRGEELADWMLIERREALLPVRAEISLITAGVDVQDDRLEVSLLGHSGNTPDEVYVLAHHVLRGDPSTQHLWDSLDDLLLTPLQNETGDDVPIRATAIDSGGHFTQAVYAYAKGKSGRGVFAIKGVGGEGRPLVGRASRNNVGKCPLFPVGVHTAKDLIFKRLQIEEPGPGYVHFDAALDEEYFKQLTSESLVTRFRRGVKKREFVKLRRRNEALDCLVYAIAALHILGVSPTKATKARAVEQASRPKINRPRRPASGWVNSWR